MRIARLSILLVLAACAAQPPAVQGAGPSLTFLHMNDTYRLGAVEEGRRGGFSRVATLVRQLEAEGRDVRLLHAGDFLYPSLESQLWDGEQMVEAMNYLDGLAPLYVVPGNHEFDPGSAGELVKRLEASRFDWLGDNYTLHTGDPGADRLVHRAFTFRVGDRTVGIFALTLKPADGGNTRDYVAYDQASYVEEADRVLGELDAAGADLIIGLTHLHIEDDLEIAKLKARHPAYRFTVGGHEHEPEYAEAGPASAAVMKGASNARTIWRIDVTFTDAGPEIEESMLAIDDSIPLDPDYQQIADRWRGRLLELMPYLNSKIGEAAVPLDGREVAIRNGDSNWGYFIVDQMRAAFGDPLSDLAFINGGTLRIDDFIADDITFEDIGRTFGFSSLLRRMNIDGAAFRRLLEAGYRGSGPSKGYFPQISGFRVCVDRRRPDGQRIVQLQVPGAEGRWAEIDPAGTYSLVAPDFLFHGGDGYDFDAARDVSRPGSELKYLVLDAIMKAQASGEEVGQRVDPGNPRFATPKPGEERCFD